MMTQAGDGNRRRAVNVLFAHEFRSLFDHQSDGAK